MDKRYAPTVPTPIRARSLPAYWTVGPRSPHESDAGEEPFLRPISRDDMIIAVMGPTGAGKSSFINIATKSNKAVVGHNLDSCTQIVSAIGCRHPDGQRNVVLVDTPGFDDTHRSDGDILKSIADWLVATYKEKIILSGILYLHRISDNRMAGTPLRNLSIFRELCGQEALANVILTTTLWDEVDDVTGRSRETELSTKYWRPMILAGSRVRRFNGTHREAWDIIDSLTFVRRSKPLKLQIEMVDQGKRLSETSAGLVLLRWFSDLIRQLWVLLRRIEAQLRGIRSDDEQAVSAVQAERASLMAELTDVTEQRRGLAEGRRHVLRRSFSVAFATVRRRPSTRDSSPLAMASPVADAGTTRPENPGRAPPRPRIYETSATVDARELTTCIDKQPSSAVRNGSPSVPINDQASMTLTTRIIASTDDEIDGYVVLHCSGSQTTVDTLVDEDYVTCRAFRSRTASSSCKDDTALMSNPALLYPRKIPQISTSLERLDTAVNAILNFDHTPCTDSPFPISYSPTTPCLSEDHSLYIWPKDTGSSDGSSFHSLLDLYCYKRSRTSSIITLANFRLDSTPPPSPSASTSITSGQTSVNVFITHNHYHSYSHSGDIYSGDIHGGNVGGRNNVNSLTSELATMIERISRYGPHFPP